LRKDFVALEQIVRTIRTDRGISLRQSGASRRVMAFGKLKAGCLRRAG